jgi:DNA polymerase III alpha subunit (gram-positive type)
MDNNNRYIALDVETGGIGIDKSLLTAYFEVLDGHLNTLDSLNLQIRSDVYKVTAEALSINKIDLVLHDQQADSKSIAGNKLLKLIQNHSENGKIKLIPIGHGVAFDLHFIWEHLLGRKTFEAYTSYRKLDTAVIAQFLKLSGSLDEDVSGSLTSLVTHYDINVPCDKQAHDAKWDTRATIEVLKAQLKQSSATWFYRLQNETAILGND